MENEVSLSGGVVVTSSDKSTQDHSRRLYALAGLLAAGLALAVSELVAGLLFSAPSLILAIGERTIDLTPGAVERWAIQDARHERQAGTDHRIGTVTRPR